MNSVGPKLGRYYMAVMAVYLIAVVTAEPAYAVTDIFTVARSIIIDVYNGIAGISTVSSDPGIVPWLIFATAIVRVGRKIDDIVCRMGLNPAHTGSPLGRSFRKK